MVVKNLMENTIYSVFFNQNRLKVMIHVFPMIRSSFKIGESDKNHIYNLLINTFATTQ